MSRTVPETLTTAMFHFEYVQKYQVLDLADQMVFDAICMRLSAALESLARLPSDDARRLFGSDWPDMLGMRNRIAHSYLILSPDRVRLTLQDDVPDIITIIMTELDRS